MKPIIVMQMDFGMGGGSAMYGTIKKVFIRNGHWGG